MPVSMNKVVRCLLIKRRGASRGTGSPVEHALLGYEKTVFRHSLLAKSHNTPL